MSNLEQNKKKVYRFLDFNEKRESSTLSLVTISASPQLVDKTKKHMFDVFRYKTKTPGFNLGEIPEEYIKKNYCVSAQENCRKYILKYFILDFLDEQLIKHQICCASEPKLQEVRSRPNDALEFIFKVSTVEGVLTQDWKIFNFSPPKRKLYKDLDRQAALSMKDAEESVVEPGKENVVENNDWVNIELLPLNNNNQPMFREHKNNFWLKINTKYVTSFFHNIFLGKSRDDVITTDNIKIYGLPDDILSVKGKFKVFIKSIVKQASFSLDSLRSIFSLKSKQDIHEKLIEIYSFRNDVSQRKLIIEEAFRVILAKLKFEVPGYLILRRQESLLKDMRKLPDYNVYKADANFCKHVSALSEKQLKEEILIEHIAKSENISTSPQEISDYLGLISHDRLSEFVYFKHLSESLEDSTHLIRQAQLELIILKEKVLNFIIKTLTKGKS
jgi:FKBP-type peptidyl-prolyl cis-trans isomerase (trigger factor)